MEIKTTSGFKDKDADSRAFQRWVEAMEQANQRQYLAKTVNTSLGHTMVYGLHTQESQATPLVIFPGARTSSLVWDFDRALDAFGADRPIYLVETNGLPNLSSGQTPDIKSEDWGHWAQEVLQALSISEAFVAGASFGGLVAAKLALTHPQSLKALFLLNPGCLQSFSLALRNLYLNLLPLAWPGVGSVEKFLRNAVFSPPNHHVSSAANALLVEYQLLALKRYRDRTQKPYFMGDELRGIGVDTYLLLGDQDILFPYAKSEANAREYIATLREVKVFEQVGHGIETYVPALEHVHQTMAALD